MPQPDPALIQPFASAADFDGWLAANHATARELWLKLFKAASGVATVSKPEAIDAALCWGWIDGQIAAFDTAAFLTRFTPRRPGSAWSRINRDRAEALIAAGRMQPPGLAQVAAAQADGRWQAAYAGQCAMTIPEDFLRALDAWPAAKATYQGLNRANLYAVAYRLETARSPETREKRIAAILDRLARGETFH